MFSDNNIKFGISKKNDGQMILRDSVALVNRKKYFEIQGIDIKNVISTELVHGNHVEVVTKNDTGRTMKDTDGLITNEKKFCLTITVSDCLPIFFYDKQNKVIGIAHAGWKGVVGGIVVNLAKQMNKKFKSNFGEIKTYIGPHIKKYNFKIKDDIVGEFKNYPKAIIDLGDKIYVDLELIVQEQLIDLGLKEKNIEIDKNCTYRNRDYFSYRRDKPKKVTSQIAFICLS